MQCAWAHALDRGVGGAAALAAQRGIPFFVREQEGGRWSFTTHRTMVGARVLVVGAGDIGREIGRMLAGSTSS